MNKFNANQIVKGKFGYFVVMGYSMIGGESLVIVKSYNPDLDKVAAGEIALTEDALQAI